MKEDENKPLNREAFIARFGDESTAVRRCACYIACVAFDIGSEDSTVIMEGVTEDGVEKGDWEFTIRRIDK